MITGVKFDNFESISKDRIELAQRIASDEMLCKCLLCNEENFKDYEPTQEEIEGLMWKHIYPCRYLPDTQIAASSFITMQFSYTKSEKSKFWKVGTITLYLVCHKEVIKTKYGVLRYDYMLQRVNQLLNDTRNDTWLGRIELSQLDEVIYDTSGNFPALRARYVCTEQM